MLLLFFIELFFQLFLVFNIALVLIVDGVWRILSCIEEWNNGLSELLEMFLFANWERFLLIKLNFVIVLSDFLFLLVELLKLFFEWILTISII